MLYPFLILMTSRLIFNNLCSLAQDYHSMAIRKRCTITFVMSRITLSVLCSNGESWRSAQRRVELRCAGPKPRSRFGWGGVGFCLPSLSEPSHPVKRKSQNAANLCWSYASARTARSTGLSA
ncbi:hypothetical protein V8F20_000773 [Naviculisporaceae sp. PSN 640]